MSAMWIVNNNNDDNNRMYIYALVINFILSTLF